jgi:glutamate synthase domain-containing protein 1
MCGIVGLFLKNGRYEDKLGKMLAEMLAVMTDRGPDSAGFAVYSGSGKETKMTVRGEDLDILAKDLTAVIAKPVSVVVHGTHAVLPLPAGSEATVRGWLAANRPDVDLVGAGKRIELFKEIGLPADVAAQFGLAEMTGTHGIGHTRMATESKVTTQGAHPFSTGPDQCLVHNGSLSNHASLRRMLSKEGISFETENDSEVAAGYLTWKMREGASLAQALETSLDDLDGFFTFVVGTEDGFAVLRDPISCKPAVMAETDDYVAFASEYRALAGLPGVDTAHVFEPEPARVYVWGREAA